MGSCIPSNGQFDQNSFNFTHNRAQNQNSLDNMRNINSQNQKHDLHQIQHWNRINTEQDQTYQYDIKIKPFYQFSKYCLAFNKQHYIYHNPVSLIIYNFREQIFYEYQLRELNLNQITSIKITENSQHIYIGTDQSFFRFTLHGIILKLKNRIKLFNVRKIKQISKNLIFVFHHKYGDKHLKLLSLDRKKQIFRIKCKQQDSRVLDYDYITRNIIYLDYKQHPIIKITNISNRQLVLKCSLFNNQQNLYLLQNTFDLLLLLSDSHNNQLILSKLDYQNQRIQIGKILIRGVLQIHYAHNQLSLFNSEHYLIFDQNYNVKHKFMIQFSNMTPLLIEDVIQFHITQQRYLIFYQNTGFVNLFIEKDQKTSVNDYYLKLINSESLQFL